VHRVAHGARDEAVVHEDVLVDVEAGVAALEVARAIPRDAVTQREVLRAGGCPDGIGLHEAEGIERSLQGGRREEAARDGSPPQIVEGHSAPSCLRRGTMSHRFGVTRESGVTSTPSPFEPADHEQALVRADRCGPGATVDWQSLP
jgi:hypothetical protein